jgi:hypothetical protein
MSNVVRKCPRCGFVTEFKHIHTPAYSDLPQTHMAGSERFVCAQCDHSIGFRDQHADLFKFVLDKKD